MCGIAGLIMPNRRPWSRLKAEAIVRGMIDTLKHRGPDSEGVWSDPDGRCVLGQRRLSIIDTSEAGLQPFPSSDGRWWITYNGEIYNFHDVQIALKQAGVSLRGRTDTEALLEAIALWGTSALAKLDGMFAFAAFDTLSGQTILARDPFGEKPLYYVKLDGGGLAFASELQALERLPGFNADIRLDAVAEVMAFQYIGAPRTIYQNVHKLPPGCWMRVSGDGAVTIDRYFAFDPTRVEKTTRPMPDLVDELEDILTRSIRRRLIADVPLGAFLSGGVDSSTVCALIGAKLGVPLRTYSIGFDGAGESEHHTARLFAEHIGAQHHERMLPAQSADGVIKLGSVLDEPNGDSSCLPTYLLSHFAREDVTVALSGDGGDEMFGGYGRYLATLNERARFDEGTLEGWAAGDVYYGDRILVANDAHLAELFGPLPRPFAHHLAALRDDLNAAHRDSLLDTMRRHDVDHYMPGAVLPKVDRMSMQHSLEVRTPFLSVELARFAETLPSNVLVDPNRGKLILREVAYRYLPRELIDLPKQGFGLPMQDWAREGLLGAATDLLASDDSRLASSFGHDAIRRFLSRHRDSAFSVYQVWAVLVLEAWLRQRPAKLPSFTERWAWAPPVVGRDHVRLELVPITANLFLAKSRPASTDPDANSPEPAQMSNETLRLARQLAEEYRSETPFADTPRTLNISQAAQTQDDPLDNAVLIFHDDDAASQWTTSMLSALARSGVSRAIARSLVNWREFDDLRLNDAIGDSCVATALAYMERRLSTVTTEVGPPNPDVIKAVKLDGFAFQAQVGSETRPVSFDDVIVFEGTRQLAPFSSRPEDVSERGEGRLTLIGGHLTFSASQPHSATPDALWLASKGGAGAPPTRFSSRKILLEDLPPEPPQKPFSDLFSLTAAPIDVGPGDRIVVCTHALSPGGAERQWVYLARTLKAQGYDVAVVTYAPLAGETAHYANWLRDAGIEIYNAERVKLGIGQSIRDWPHTIEAYRDAPEPSYTHLENARQLATTFRRLNPKVVFAQLDAPNIRAGLGAHLAGVPRVVLSFRNTIPTHFAYLNDPTLLPMYQLLASSGATRFTANSNQAALDYARWIGINDDRIVRIENALDLDVFAGSERDKPALRRAFGIPEDAPVVLGVFRISEEKDPSTFIDTCRQVLSAIQHCICLIAGVGPLESKMRQQIEALGLTERIWLLGRRDDIPDLMNMADVLLLTSRFEGMPNVIMEAQASGLPVVCTDAGGSRATLHSAAGHVAPIGDSVALSAACIEILNNHETRTAMASAGRKHAQNAFNPERMAAEYLRVAVWSKHDE